MRAINEIIIHCSATQEGRDFTVEDITNWHKQRGFDTIGYHFVIYRDGSIHHGRPISKVGAHCTGHNTNTIGVCYIGGLDRNNKSKDTRTPQQRVALKELITRLKQEFKITKISGHNQYAAKDCPCFDVKKETQLGLL